MFVPPFLDLAIVNVLTEGTDLIGPCLLLPNPYIPQWRFLIMREVLPSTSVSLSCVASFIFRLCSEPSHLALRTSLFSQGA